MHCRTIVWVLGLTMVGDIVTGCSLRSCCHRLTHRLEELTERYARLDERAEMLVNRTCPAATTTTATVCAEEDRSCPDEGLVVDDRCFAPLYDAERNFGDAMDACVTNNFTGLAVIDSRERYENLSIHVNTYAVANSVSSMYFVIGTLYYHGRNETVYLDGRTQTWDSIWWRFAGAASGAPYAETTRTRIHLTGGLDGRGYINVPPSDLAYPFCQRPACPGLE